MTKTRLDPSEPRNAERAFHMNTYPRAPITVVRGEGLRVWDDQGREFLDFTSGLCVNTLGHCHPVVVDAVRAQVGTLIHATNGVYTLPQLELARLLVEHSALDKVFFCNSGAEANECAIKLARKWGRTRKGGAYEIITATTGFHGRTLGTMAATGHRHLQQDFEPLPAGFKQVEFNDLAALRDAITEQTAAVLLEPIQGVNGVEPATQEYLQGVRALCDEKGVLLMLDEIQSGVGRTGTLWAYEGYGIEPDVMTVAKGLGGGVAIGACLAKDAVAVFQPGDHASTFGGNPLACAAGRAVLQEVIARDLPGHARRLGARLRTGLGEIQAESGHGITAVRGAGLWFGIEFGEGGANAVWERCLRRGVLLVRSGTGRALRVSPSLTVTEQECERFLEVFRQAVRS
jgi:predicted acetylornithine/succinylornithine family transaminase